LLELNLPGKVGEHHNLRIINRINPQKTLGAIINRVNLKKIPGGALKVSSPSNKKIPGGVSKVSSLNSNSQNLKIGEIPVKVLI
jgi:hypothetical protein